MLGASSRIAARTGLRADARRNQERILAAARAVFAERGIDAPMATVARRAGVGVATLYRRFPTRDALVRAAFTQQMDTCARAFTEAIADPDPWRGFRRLFETVCALQREERGFPAAFMAAFPDDAAAHARARSQAEQGLLTLIGRAQAASALRGDFRLSDLAVAFLAHGGLVTALPDDDAASRRLVAYLLEAFRAGPANGTLPAPSALSVHGFAVPAG
ncbi:helix-turn-helix domain-containing protein [Amycolatopsis sp. NPDC048633]|uniref:TetR/AcrR family transcriptional regulator n=1 Tax=Amycolatopsis sp. NPDC048633 TaxID=3157095 RepID=UPI0033C0DBCB